MLTGAASLTGVDADAEAIRYGVSRFPGIDFRVGRMEALPLESDCFDVAVCLEGIEDLYLSDATRFLAEARRVLRPDGRIIVTAPLLQEGRRHSGNPHHSYEFTEAGLRDLLEQHFETISLEIFECGEGPEVRYVGQPRPAGEPVALRVPDRVDLCGRVNRWLEGMRAGDGFRSAAATPPTLLSTCIAILLHEGLESLEGVSPQERKSWCVYVQSCQDPSTGRFQDAPGELAGRGPAPPVELTTYFAIQALDALGAAALHPLHFLAQFEAPEAIATWLDRLNWSDPELESNRVMFLLAGLIHRAEKEGHAAAPGLYHKVLDWLDRAQNTRTGLWGAQKASLPDEITAAYRFFPFYDFVRRPVCAVSKVIDAALSLREGSGGGAREDLAVIDLLAAFTKQFDYRAAEIKKFLIHGFWSVWNLQNADGGFPDDARAGTEKNGGSDVWASWLRLLALQTIHCTYAEDLPEIGGWTFRRWPAWGFHRAGRGLSDLEKERLSVWLRPLSLPPGATPPTSDAAETPDVSIVITCFNLGRYLYEAVDSVLRQTLQSFEIILVDDGSTEEFTTVYLDIFSAPRTRVIRTQNQGLSAARNAGTRLARGQYICSLDADDRLKPAFLEKARRILDDAEDIGFVSCYYEIFDEDHSVYRYDRCRFPELLVQNEVCGVSVFRKDAWRKVGGYCTSLKAMEDWDFWIGILEQGYRGEVIPEILFEYRARVGSMYSVARRPENYSATAGQLIVRHQESYRRYFLDVLRLKTRQFAELVAIRQQELDEFGQGKNWLEEQLRSWQHLAWQRQKDLLAYEAGKAWLEEQVRNWQQVAEEWRQRIAALESQFAEERSRLAQQVESWRAATERRSERIVVLEDTIAQMRATRAWRAAEWSVGILRRFSGFCRGIILVGSPRLTSSNAKNFLLGLRLIFGAAEGRATWAACFDANYYNNAYPDVARSGVAPWFHYLLCGYLENRNPSASFDSAYYRSRHPDVRDAGINPLLHYSLFGRKEQRISTLARTLSSRPPSSPAALAPQFHRTLFAREEVSSLEDRETPLVSVVVPCFNYGQYVEQAIHSVLAQTFTNIEIIVVEGGSTDGTTPQVLRDLERKGLPGTRFVYRTEAHMAGENRNFAIGLARGRYICCLDADDLLKPIYLEMAVFLAEFYGYDIVYPSVRCFEGSDFDWLLGDPTWPEIMDGNQICTVAMFRRAAWARVGGFLDWGKGETHVPEDWAFWVRLLGHGFRGKNIREPLMLYRVHSGGLWSTRGSTLEYEREAIREANPQLFVSGFVPPTPSLDRPAAAWDNLIEPAGSLEELAQNGVRRETVPDPPGGAHRTLCALEERARTTEPGSAEYLRVPDLLEGRAGPVRVSHPAILFAVPLIINGGAEKVFATLARALIQRGHKVVVITTLVPAATIPDCTESFEAVTPYLYSLPRLLQDQEDRWSDFLYFLLKRHQIGTILIAGCDFVYQLLPEIADAFPQIAILDQLFNDGVHFHTNHHYAAYIDTTFVPSQKLADQLISGCREADKVCVIPHGIDMEELAVPDATFDSSKLPQHFRGKFLVSFFGRLSVEKAPADFVEIARRLRSYEEICFLMTGEGQERAAVLALIERYGMQDRIHTPGFVDNIHTLMALSDVVVVPSHLDGMPLVVFEAQACGKPVVASAVGSIPDVIADGKTGLLCAPGDVNGFAERILKLWRSPELRRSIGHAARAWVRAHHSAESMNARYIETFDRGRSSASSAISAK
jgi:glycosyltransferase involved in cell wall biosynthesis